MIIDSHCHLNMAPLKDNLEEVIKNAKEAGISLMQTICVRISEFEELKAIADKYENVFASVGVHPNNVSESEIVSAQTLLKLAEHKKVIGFGETGLDYFYSKEHKKIQKQSFINHIEAARLADLPVIIHARDAEEDILEILETEMKKGKFKALLHCFTGSTEFAKKALELGAYISISGIITFKNAVSLQETVKDIPLNRLLVETDAPYLAPVPFRGKTNEPAYTKYTVDFLSNLLEVSSDKLAAQTSENFYKLFAKAKKRE